MNTEPNPKVSYIPEYIVVLGYLLFFCILVTACIVFYYLNRSSYKSSSPPTNEFVTSLPLATPSPHVSSIAQFETSSILFQDDFSNNQNRWLNSEDDTKEKIDKGKLFFQSRDEGDYSIIRCEECPYNVSPYYLEARLSTNIATDESYGIAFRSEEFEDFYLFIINPESKKYFLWHRTSEQWSLRCSGESTLIHPYPESNTLGLYASKGSLELYINGDIIDSYAETGREFYPGFFGFYVTDSWFGVFVDKVVIYKVRN